MCSPFPDVKEIYCIPLYLQAEILVPVKFLQITQNGGKTIEHGKNPWINYRLLYLPIGSNRRYLLHGPLLNWLDNIDS